MPEFSDPAWWPKPPPKLPTRTSTTTVLFRGLVPLIALAAALTLLLTRHTHPAASVPAVASGGACVHAGNPTPERDAAARLQAGQSACAALRVGTPAAGASARPLEGPDRFESCLRGSSLRRAGGRAFGGAPPASVRAVAALCRSLSRGTAATTTVAPAPIAPPKA